MFQGIFLFVCDGCMKKYLKVLFCLITLKSTEVREKILERTFWEIGCIQIKIYPQTTIVPNYGVFYINGAWGWSPNNGAPPTSLYMIPREALFNASRRRRSNNSFQMFLRKQFVHQEQDIMLPIYLLGEHRLAQTLQILFTKTI